MFHRHHHAFLCDSGVSDTTCVAIAIPACGCWVFLVRIWRLFRLINTLLERERKERDLVSDELELDKMVSSLASVPARWAKC
jgi:hypothetical protein